MGNGQNRFTGLAHSGGSVADRFDVETDRGQRASGGADFDFGLPVPGKGRVDHQKAAIGFRNHLSVIENTNALIKSGRIHPDAKAAAAVAELLQGHQRTACNGAGLQQVHPALERHVCANPDGTGIPRFDNRRGQNKGGGEKMARDFKHISFPGMVRTTAPILYTALSLMLPFAPGALAQETLEMVVQGDVAPSCAVSFASDAMTVQGALPGALTASADFNVDCNAPFSYTLASRNGALAYDGSTMLAGGSDSMGSFVRYDATVMIPLEDGAPAVISDTCSSDTIDDDVNTCVFTNSGTAIALDNTGTLSIATAAASEPLLAGDYTDTLTLTITTQ